MHYNVVISNEDRTKLDIRLTEQAFVMLEEQLKRDPLPDFIRLVDSVLMIYWVRSKDVKLIRCCETDV